MALIGKLVNVQDGIGFFTGIVLEIGNEFCGDRPVLIRGRSEADEGEETEQVFLLVQNNVREVGEQK